MLLPKRGGEPGNNRRTLRGEDLQERMCKFDRLESPGGSAGKRLPLSLIPMEQPQTFPGTRRWKRGGGGRRMAVALPEKPLAMFHVKFSPPGEVHFIEESWRCLRLPLTEPLLVV